MMETELPPEFKASKDKKQNVLKKLNDVKQAIDETENVDEVLIMLKLDGEYVRFSTMLEKSTEMVAMLEILKHDILNRMKR